MLSALAYHFKHRSSGGLSAVGTDFARPGVVHRLDRDTTGCIVFAKQDEAHWKLGHSFEHRRVEKRYVALVHGKVEPVIDTLEYPIGPHPSREKGLREKQVVRHDELGKPSVTVCRVLEWYRVARVARLGVARLSEPGEQGIPAQPTPPARVVSPGWDRGKEEGEARLGEPGYPTTGVNSPWYSLIELELRTGRTHQIRVHMAHSLYPIVGDDMYGGRGFTTPDGLELAPRQALHAALLGFEHPITGQKLEFTAPLRGDMISLVKHLRATAHWQHIDPPPPGTRVNFNQLVPG